MGSDAGWSRYGGTDSGRHRTRGSDRAGSHRTSPDDEDTAYVGEVLPAVRRGGSRYDALAEPEARDTPWRDTRDRAWSDAPAAPWRPPDDLPADHRWGATPAHPQTGRPPTGYPPADHAPTGYPQTAYAPTGEAPPGRVPSTPGWSVSPSRDHSAQPHSSAEPHTSAPDYGSTPGYSPPGGYASTPGYGTAGYDPAPRYDPTPRYDSAPRHSADQGHGSDQGYSSGQGYSAGQSYSSGQSYSRGGGYGVDRAASGGEYGSATGQYTAAADTSAGYAAADTAAREYEGRRRLRDRTGDLSDYRPRRARHGATDPAGAASSTDAGWPAALPAAPRHPDAGPGHPAAAPRRSDAAAPYAEGRPAPRYTRDSPTPRHTDDRPDSRYVEDRPSVSYPEAPAPGPRYADDRPSVPRYADASTGPRYAGDRSEAPRYADRPAGRRYAEDRSAGPRYAEDRPAGPRDADARSAAADRRAIGPRRADVPPYAGDDGPAGFGRADAPHADDAARYPEASRSATGSRAGGRPRYADGDRTGESGASRGRRHRGAPDAAPVDYDGPAAYPPPRRRPSTAADAADRTGAGQAAYRDDTAPGYRDTARGYRDTARGYRDAAPGHPDAPGYGPSVRGREDDRPRDLADTGWTPRPDGAAADRTDPGRPRARRDMTGAGQPPRADGTATDRLRRDPVETGTGRPRRPDDTSTGRPRRPAETSTGRPRRPDDSQRLDETQAGAPRGREVGRYPGVRGEAPRDGRPDRPEAGRSRARRDRTDADGPPRPGRPRADRGRDGDSAATTDVVRRRPVRSDETDGRGGPARPDSASRAAGYRTGTDGRGRRPGGYGPGVESIDDRAYPPAQRRPADDSTGDTRTRRDAPTRDRAGGPPRPRRDQTDGGQRAPASYRDTGDRPPSRRRPILSDETSTGMLDRPVADGYGSRAIAARPAAYRQAQTGTGSPATYRGDTPGPAGPATSTQSRIRRSEADEAAPGRGSQGYAQAMAYTALWFAVPLVVLVLWSLTLNGEASANCVDGLPCDSQRGAALASLWGELPKAGAILLLSLGVALVLRKVSASWKASTVGFAAAVVGGGLATVAVSVITGQPLG